MDERIYWSQLVHAVDEALKANDMRDKVEIWGPEVSGMTNEVTKDWFQYQLDNTSTCVDQWTGRVKTSDVVVIVEEETQSVCLRKHRKR